MLIKITEKCSMGCTHCLSDCKPTGKHMDFDTFKKTIEFAKKYKRHMILISGGEPLEHPEFKKFLNYAVENIGIVIVTTNGYHLQNEYEYVKSLNEKSMVLFQVTYVEKYYKNHYVDLSLPVFHLPNIMVCTEIEHMYPQGRALENKFEYSSNGSKCTNIRLVAHQVLVKNIEIVMNALESRQLVCTPSISINGDIKLGESDLCPAASNINKDNDTIFDDILKFKCNKCDHINWKLSPTIKKILGEY